MKVQIYPLTDVFYNSYYIEGFYRIFGRNNVGFSFEGFPDLPERFFAAIVQDGGRELKIIIDAFDSSRISGTLLEWSDVYGKVNYNKASLPDVQRNKILAIGPSFGIRIWSLPQTISIALFHYIQGRKRIHFKRNFLANYWRQYKRLPLKEYLSGSEFPGNYIYFVSSLWKKEEATNSSRARFIKACQELEEIEFEGGFAPRSDNETLGFDKLIAERIVLKKYLRNIKRSVLVFNTPAVESCHGWKLAEFLALGKAIISTKNPNELAYPLLHQEHLHYVDDEKQAIKSAIQKIRSDYDYKQKLENNARSYYNEHLAPERVVQKILDHRVEK